MVYVYIYRYRDREIERETEREVEVRSLGEEGGQCWWRGFKTNAFGLNKQTCLIAAAFNEY